VLLRLLEIRLGSEFVNNSVVLIRQIPFRDRNSVEKVAVM